MKSDEQLLSELEQATKDLLFMSESDYPFETVHWQGGVEPTEQDLRQAAGLAGDAHVEVRSLDDLFRNAVSEPQWKGERERATAKRYQALARLLTDNLRDLKVYRVGEVNISVFIIGRTGAGNWAGLSTHVVET